MPADTLAGVREFPGKSILRPWALAARRVRSGSLRLDDLAYGRPSFSQFGEDRVLEQFFWGQPDGFYVDVGAYHPVMGSNTFLLYRRGWHGINLEPDPAARATIEQRRPRDLTLPYAISEGAGTAEFLLKGSFSGIDDERHLWSRDGERIAVKTRRLGDVLDDHLPGGTVIDLLDVDCEGHDLVVLQSNDWVRYRPRVVLVEDHKGSGVGDFLGDLGYKHYAVLGLTAIFTDF